MIITIQVFDKDDAITFDLPEDTTIQQIKSLVAEKLNLLNNIQDMTIIFNQRIINDDSVSILQLEYSSEDKFILFLPRIIRSQNENFNKSPYKIPQPNENQNNQTFSQEINPMDQRNNNSNNSRQLRYTPLGSDSPHHILLQKLAMNIQRVVNRKSPYENPWKTFLLENNTPFLDPLVLENFEIASKLNESQIMFICDSLYMKKLTLPDALHILAAASYNPDIARGMI